VSAPARREPPVLPSGGGLLLVDKPAGCTSHDVVSRVRRVLGMKRVGHAGTLDPMATGLLVVAVDRATKLLGHLALTDKTYLATIRLGVGTDSDDADGTVVATADPADLAAVSDADLRQAMQPLTGDLMQVPSAVSAIKVDGRRAYDRVRAGEQVRLAARPVTVSRFDLLGPPRRTNGSLDLDVVVDCSTGTYVRSLARDLGAALGVGGHLIALRRTSVGPFDVVSAIDLVDTGPVDDSRSGDTREGRPRWAPPSDELAVRAAAAIMPPAQAVRAAFRVRVVDATQSLDLRHGRPIPAAGLPGTYGAVDDSGALIALVGERDGLARSVLGWSGAG
jgi:tRNA pseudouridine55 synthase